MKKYIALFFTILGILIFIVACDNAPQTTIGVEDMTLLERIESASTFAEITDCYTTKSNSNANHKNHTGETKNC